MKNQYWSQDGAGFEVHLLSRIDKFTESLDRINDTLQQGLEEYVGLHAEIDRLEQEIKKMQSGG